MSSNVDYSNLTFACFIETRGTLNYHFYIQRDGNENDILAFYSHLQKIWDQNDRNQFDMVIRYVDEYLESCNEIIFYPESKVDEYIRNRPQNSFKLTGRFNYIEIVQHKLWDKAVMELLSQFVIIKNLTSLFEQDQDRVYPRDKFVCFQSRVAPRWKEKRLYIQWHGNEYELASMANDLKRLHLSYGMNLNKTYTKNEIIAYERDQREPVYTYVYGILNYRELVMRQRNIKFVDYLTDILRLNGIKKFFVV